MLPVVFPPSLPTFTPPTLTGMPETPATPQR
jgi:hypothetical protein